METKKDQLGVCGGKNGLNPKRYQVLSTWSTDLAGVMIRLP